VSVPSEKRVEEPTFELIVCPTSRENPRNSEADVIELRDGRLLLAYSESYGGVIDDHGPARISARISSDGDALGGANSHWSRTKAG